MEQGVTPLYGGRPGKVNSRHRGAPVMAGARSDVNAQNAIRREARGGGYLSLMAAWTLGIISGGIVVTPWSFLACSAAFAITSATSLPSTTALHPGIKSPHLIILD